LVGITDFSIKMSNFLIPDFGHVKDDFFEKVTKEVKRERKNIFGDKFFTIDDMTDEEFTEWVEKHVPF